MIRIWIKSASCTELLVRCYNRLAVVLKVSVGQVKKDFERRTGSPLHHQRTMPRLREVGKVQLSS
jgi:hypothetical protein